MRNCLWHPNPPGRCNFAQACAKCPVECFLERDVEFPCALLQQSSQVVLECKGCAHNRHLDASAFDVKTSAATPYSSAGPAHMNPATTCFGDSPRQPLGGNLRWLDLQPRRHNSHHRYAEFRPGQIHPPHPHAHAIEFSNHEIQPGALRPPGQLQRLAFPLPRPKHPRVRDVLDGVACPPVRQYAGPNPGAASMISPNCCASRPHSRGLNVRTNVWQRSHRS